MKRVTLISSEYRPMPAAASTRISAWVEELSSHGFSAFVLTALSAQAAPGIDRSVFRTPDNRANLPIRFLQEALLGLDLGCRLFLRRRKTDFCIITSPPFFMAFICSLFARLGKIAYIFDARDRYPSVLFDLGILSPRGVLPRLLLKMERTIYENAVQVTTVTNGLLETFRKDFPRVDFRLLRNGFDENAFDKSSASVVKHDRFTIVYHGRLGRFYDLILLKRTIELVGCMDPEIRFLLIGELPDEILDFGQDNLVILPAMPSHKLAQELAPCHLGICLLKDLPAMHSAFPAKAYDFIGAGLPLIVGSTGELADLVRQSGCGLVFEGHCPEKVASEIVALKNDFKRMKTMISEVLKVRELYGRRTCLREYLSTMEQRQDAS